MKPTAFWILLATMSLIAIGPAEAGKDREPVVIGPFQLTGCGFPIDVAVVTNKEYQDVTELDDGTVIFQIRGHLVLSFTNHLTGFSIVRNVSGPTTEIDHPDGTITLIGEGNNWFGFGPASQANIHQPGLVFTSGRVVLQIEPPAVQTFSLNGKLVNGCDLLDH